MKHKRKLGRKLLSFLLTLAMVVGMMPGMGLTAYAANSIVCTTDDIGKVLCTDGSIYASVSAATSAGKTPAAMIAYLDMENNNGLALALSDDYKDKWTDITSHSPAVTGGTWVLASETQWTQMITAMGSDGLRDGFSSIGGTNLQNDFYWSSTASSHGHMRYSFNSKGWKEGGSYIACYGRACLMFNFTPIVPTTYEVTYKVVNGTWSDDTTTDKTETVQSGSAPASVPTGMKAASGYTGGSWDTDPTSTTITGATTFTYTFEAIPTYTVTYKVVNGTWSDDSTTDKTETVQSGSAPASVPTGMKAASGYTGGSWDTNPAEATITGATTFTYTFTALPTYEVTYKVVNGTWSDDTTTDKTETVQSGSTPASVPTGMKAASGYTGGAWDTDPTDATITGATTFTYTFTALPSYEVTYKVVNGTWSDDSTTDKTETVQSGSKPASVPTGMKAASGYTGGAWDTDPTDATITGATTFTYTFTALPSYEVTYKVVNGTWSDGTTTDMTETVQSGSTPASVPTGMKAASGYTGGAWDTDPTGTTITGATTFTYTFQEKNQVSYTVTFKVENGKWNDGSSDDKKVTLTGYEGDTLTLSANDIPDVGSKPAEGFKAGSWDVTPSTDTEITGATTYTYTYAQKDSISQTVTFKVVNGSWNDETTTDKTVTLTGYEGDTLKLTADQIPAVGSKPNDTYKAGGWDTTPSADTEITADTTYTYTYAQKDSISQTVTFKVVNGSWNDETTTDKTVTLTGYEGDTLKLTANQIPAVGSKPNDTYKAGSWDTTPSTDTAITADTTYTYTYAQKDAISQTVTFKVVNGSWNDETTTDKTVTLTGYEGDTLKLAADQIPTVGTKPNDTYKAGSWDVTPSTDTVITAATTYTYTYAQKDSISQTVTFKVVNGSWNDETTTDKTITLTGYEGDRLKLTADQIPEVGDKPNDTYKAGSWDVTPSTDTAITEATTYTYTYVAKEASVVTKAPEAKTLTYNGQAQELVTAGTATGGEVQYALGNATEATQPYTTTIPTATNAGTYKIYYYIKGDDNHKDDGSEKEPKGSVETTIKKAAQDKPTETFAVAEASDDKTADGKISGLDKAKTYQYSADDGKTWTDVKAGSTEIVVKSGTYQIRYAEDKNHEAGKAASVTVTAKAAPTPEPAKTNATINLKSVTQKNNKVQVSWTKVNEADGYDVYIHYCGSKAKKAAKTIKGNSTTSASFKKIDGKKINHKKNFHVKVYAYKMVNGKKKIIAKTITAHLAGTKSVKYTNPKALKLTKSTYNIKVKKTAQIKAKVTLENSKKKLLPKSHGAKFRYKSSNTKIATVNKNGKITGKSKGTCYIYVYTINGLMKKVKVTVK